MYVRLYSFKICNAIAYLNVIIAYLNAQMSCYAMSRNTNDCSNLKRNYMSLKCVFKYVMESRNNNDCF